MKTIIKVVVSILILFSFTSCKKIANLITPLDRYEFKFFIIDENGENVAIDCEETLQDMDIYYENAIYKYGEEYPYGGYTSRYVALSDDLEGAFTFLPVYARHGARLLVNYGEYQWEVLINVAWNDGEYITYNMDFVVDDEPAEIYLDTDAVVLRM